MHQRIKKLIAIEGSQAKFCKKIGEKPTTISSMLKNETGVKYHFIMNVINAYKNLNPMWLLMGEGNMYLDKAAAKDLHSSGEDEMVEKVLEMMEDRVGEGLLAYKELTESQNKRIAMLEAQLKKHAPQAAKDLGLD